MKAVRPTQSHRSQHGFSLVELMVAITLGMVLLAGIVTIFVSSKHAFTLQQGSSRAQESGRVGLFIVARVARQAGFYGDPTQYQSVSTLFASPNTAVSGTEGGTTNPDTLDIRYQGHQDRTIVDCLGNVVEAASMVTNTFSLGALNSSTNARPLICTRAFPPDAALPPTTLMEGVTDFQVEYGIDTNGDSLADQYVNADAVTNWATVHAIRIVMTTNSIDKVGAASATANRLTQTYYQTIELRNL